MDTTKQELMDKRAALLRRLSEIDGSSPERLVAHRDERYKLHDALDEIEIALDADDEEPR